MRICHVTTSDVTLGILFAGQLRYKLDLGFEVWAVSSPGPHVGGVRAQGVRVHTVPMTRASVGFADLTALVRLIWFFAAHRFDIVEMSTPKAILLGSIAACLTRQPLRIVTIRGAPYDGYRGWRRQILTWPDRVGCALAHRVVAISHELREAIVRDGICRRDKATTYLSGSSNGLDLGRFTPTPDHVAFGRELRRRHGIADDALVIGTVARLRVQKGIVELIEAFETLLARGRNIFLLLVGGFDTVDPIPADVRERIERHRRVIATGHQPQPELYYAAMDVLAFPTYREGFGNVPLEASAMGLPLVVTDVIGCREAAPAGIASIAVPPRDAAALAEALDRLLGDPELRRRLGDGGQRRARSRFARERIWRAMLADYAMLLARQGKALPPRAAIEAMAGRPDVTSAEPPLSPDGPPRSTARAR
jgi:glycosyltransferase involved in cell wall biosynthesis